MGCPNCGSERRTTLAPGLYTCSNELVEYYPNPYDLSGALGLPRHPVYWTCSTTYQERTGEVTTETTCPVHALFAVGVCANCRNVPTCGMCPNRECTGCAAARAARDTENERVADEARRSEQAEREALARAVEEQRAREDAEHERLVAEHLEGHGGGGAVRAHVEELEHTRRARFSKKNPPEFGCMAIIFSAFFAWLSLAGMLSLFEAIGYAPDTVLDNQPTLGIVIVVLCFAPGVLVALALMTAGPRYRRRQREIDTELEEHRRLLTFCGDPGCSRCTPP